MRPLWGGRLLLVVGLCGASGAVLWWCLRLLAAPSLAVLPFFFALSALAWCLAVLPVAWQAFWRELWQARRRSLARHGRLEVMWIARTWPAATPQTFSPSSLPMQWHGIIPSSGDTLHETVLELVLLLGSMAMLVVGIGLAGILAFSAAVPSFQQWFVDWVNLRFSVWFLVAGCVALLAIGVPLFVRARRGPRPRPFELTATVEGLQCASPGRRPQTLRWDEARLLEVGFPVYDHDYPPPSARLYTLYGRRGAIRWYDGGQLAPLLAVIERSTGLVPRTVDPLLAVNVPPPWRILERQSNGLIVAVYLLVVAAAVLWLPPTGSAPVNAALFGFFDLGTLYWIALFAVFSLAETFRYVAWRQRGTSPAALAVLPPVPLDAAGVYEVRYHPNQVGAWIQFAMGCFLSGNLLVLILWLVAPLLGGQSGAQQALGFLALPLGLYGALVLAQAVVKHSVRYCNRIGSEDITLVFLGQIGDRRQRVLAHLAWHEVQQMRVIVREGRVTGFRVASATQRISWPAYGGRPVRSVSGGAPLTTWELAALIADRTGIHPEVDDRTGQPYQMTAGFLRLAEAVLSVSSGPGR